MRSAPHRSIAVVLALAVVVGTGGAASAHGRPPAPTPTPVTRAALDPALVAGRGATVDFVEQEAEKAATNGTVIGPDRTAYTLPAEASGRSAVKLAPGQYVEFTLPKAANAITVRYSIPDAATGGGITAPLDVTVNGGGKRTMTLTSQYSWLYNQYPFSNDPNAGLLHPDWWITECGCVPAATTPTPTITTPFRPMHFYDEQRLLLGRTYPAGDKVRLTAPAGTAAAWTVIDLLDSELVGLPHVRLHAANVLLFGADPFGQARLGRRLRQGHRLRAEEAPAGLRAAGHLPGEPAHRRRRRDDRGRRAAGTRSSRAREVALATPAPDGSVHTGVGFYGKDAADGGSRNVHLSGFAIEGDVRERIDTDQVNGIGGALSDSTIDGLYIHHTKVGMWFDGPMNNLVVKNNVIVDQIADGLNFHTGVTNSRRVEQLRPQHRRRRPGDVVGEDRQRRQHVRPQHGADADARQRHRDLRRHRQHGRRQPGRRPDPRGQRASRSAPGSAPSRSPGTSGSPTTPRSAPARTS